MASSHSSSRISILAVCMTSFLAFVTVILLFFYVFGCSFDVVEETIFTQIEYVFAEQVFWVDGKDCSSKWFSIICIDYDGYDTIFFVDVRFAVLMSKFLNKLQGLFKKFFQD